MIQLIAIDLDGTLLTDDKKLPPDFFEIARTLLKRKVSIVIASGRPFHNVAEVFNDLKDDLYFACDNGTYVVYQDKELLVNPLPADSVKKFIDLSRTLENVYPVMCGKNLAFVENTNPHFMKQALKYYQEYEVVPDLNEVTDMVLKISMCDLVDAETNSYPHYKKFEDDYSIAISGKMWLDITGPDGNKGTALQTIQEHLGIGAEETLSFGDYLNDMGLIKNAEHSYAMKNAHPDIIEAANYITPLDNNHHGVMQVIKELMEI